MTFSEFANLEPPFEAVLVILNLTVDNVSERYKDLVR